MEDTVEDTACLELDSVTKILKYLIEGEDGSDFLLIIITVTTTGWWALDQEFAGIHPSDLHGPFLWWEFRAPLCR